MDLKKIRPRNYFNSMQKYYQIASRLQRPVTLFGDRTRVGDYLWKRKFGMWVTVCKAGTDHTDSNNGTYYRHRCILNPGQGLLLVDTEEPISGSTFYPAYIFDHGDLLSAIILEGNYER